MNANKKYALHVTQQESQWSATITRQVTSRKTHVSKCETGFESEQAAQAWGEEQLAVFAKAQAGHNARKKAK